MVSRLDRMMALVVQAAQYLVLPLSLLLFLQWPLREWVQQGAREANDLAQLGFGLYVAIAITYATRQRAHLATDVLAHRYRPALRRRIGRLANIFIALPWAAFVLYAAWPTLRQSVGQLEAFPDTTNPGYFLLRLAVALCALLVGLQALVDVLKREDD